VKEFCSKPGGLRGVEFGFKIVKSSFINGELSSNILLDGGKTALSAVSLLFPKHLKF